MKSVIRNVKDIAVAERRYLEHTLGQQLSENQQVVIHIINVDVEPEETTRRQTLSEAAEIARQGRANTTLQGVTDAEADAAIEEAIRKARGRGA